MIFSIFATVFTFLMIPEYKVNKMKIIYAEYLSISENFPDIQLKLAEKVYKNSNTKWEASMDGYCLSILNGWKRDI